jgi:bifunctional enzyme CysN/CysC
LIGRLLYDCDGAFEDQLAAVSRASIAKGAALDLSLLTDGLRAEREQGITIDVAYRYFATARRKFIIADAPGHEQYTRNMVTGASHSDLLVLLVDSRKGILSQTRRHLYVAWLLGIRQVILAVNKMDLVYFEQKVFQSIQDTFSRLGNSLSALNSWVIPVSALDGDNVAARSERMPWYHGPSLLELLESIPVQTAHHESPLRFPIQLVVRPNQDFRGYAGQIASGVMKPQQEVVVLPGGQRATIEQVLLDSKTVEETFYPMSVMVCLKEHLDVGRGDMLVDAHNPPTATKRFQARLIWMSANPLRPNEAYLLKHSSQVVCASVTALRRKVDVNTLEAIAADALELNDIGEVEIETHKPVFCDPYVENRLTGSFILIDPTENSTVAAGTILRPVIDEAGVSNNGAGRRATAARSAFHPGLTVWFAGLSGPGKTAICRSVLTELLVRGIRAELLDDEAIRELLDRDPGFDKGNADEDIPKIGFVARLMARHGVLVLVSAASQPCSSLEQVRAKAGNFLEVHVNTSPQTYEQRDQQSSYNNGRNGQPYPFTKIDSPDETLLSPDIECHAGREAVKESVEKVVAAILRTPGFSSEQ